MSEFKTVSRQGVTADGLHYEVIGEGANPLTSKHEVVIRHMAPIYSQGETEAEAAGLLKKYMAALVERDHANNKEAVAS